MKDCIKKTAVDDKLWEMGGKLLLIHIPINGDKIAEYDIDDYDEFGMNKYFQ